MVHWRRLCALCEFLKIAAPECAHLELQSESMWREWKRIGVAQHPVP